MSQTAGIMSQTAYRQTNIKNKIGCDNYICEQVLFVRFYSNPAPVNRSTQFHYCTVTREPEQTTLLFWSAACSVTPRGLHTAERR